MSEPVNVLEWFETLQRSSGTFHLKGTQYDHDQSDHAGKGGGFKRIDSHEFDDFTKVIHDPFGSEGPYWGNTVERDWPTQDMTFGHHFYFTGGAENWNSWLRGTGHEATPSDRKNIEALAELIDGSDGFTDNAIVFRGVRQGALPDLQPGDELTDPGFMSTSFDENVATNFGGAGDVLEIAAPAGTKGVLGFAGMDEVIMQRGTTLRVDEVEEEEGMRWIKATIVQQ